VNGPSQFICFRRGKPRYDKLAAYRNALTHVNSPKVMLVPNTVGQPVPHVPHEDHFSHYAKLSWPEQERRFRTHLFEWGSFPDVCARVQAETIKWLDDAYAEVIRCLDPHLTDENYQGLWGWDTNKYGRFVARNAQKLRTLHIGSGSGFSATSGSGR
jgi:hypothetical protein